MSNRIDQYLACLAQECLETGEKRRGWVPSCKNSHSSGSCHPAVVCVNTHITLLLAAVAGRQHCWQETYHASPRSKIRWGVQCEANAVFLHQTARGLRPYWEYTSICSRFFLYLPTEKAEINSKKDREVERKKSLKYPDLILPRDSISISRNVALRLPQASF